MAALEPRRLGAAAGVGATKASEAAFSSAKPPGNEPASLLELNKLPKTPTLQPH